MKWKRKLETLEDRYSKNMLAEWLYRHPIPIHKEFLLETIHAAARALPPPTAGSWLDPSSIRWSPRVWLAAHSGALIFPVAPSLFGVATATGCDGGGSDGNDDDDHHGDDD